MLFAVWARLTPSMGALLGAVGLFAAPAFAGPPFRTDDPEPVDFQHFEIDLFSQATQTNGGWSGFLPGLEVNYGALPNLQVHAIIPQGFTAPDGGVALWRKVTDRLNLGAEVFHQTSPADGVPSSTGFNVGATYDVSENWHILASIGRGLQNTSATNLFSYYMGLQLTF